MGQSKLMQSCDNLRNGSFDIISVLSNPIPSHPIPSSLVLSCLVLSYLAMLCAPHTNYPELSLVFRSRCTKPKILGAFFMLVDHTETALEKTRITSSMVVHILGQAIKGKYRINYGLAKTFYGVGLETATKVCSKLGFYPDMRMHQLSEQQTMSITKELSEMTIDSKLLSNIRANIKMKREIGSYVGMRHSMGLPVRGQRTKTNAKTARKLNRIERKM